MVLIKKLCRPMPSLVEIKKFKNYGVTFETMWSVDDYLLLKVGE